MVLFCFFTIYKSIVIKISLFQCIFIYFFIEIVFEGVFVSSEQHIALPIEGTSVIDEDDNQNKTDQVS